MEEKLTTEELMELGTKAEDAGNFEEAVNYYQKAFEAGTTEGLLAIGCLYLFGDITEKNPAKALEWFKKIVEAGDTDGWLSMGWAYEELEDYPNAISCYEKVLTYDNDTKFDAMYALARFYLDGNVKKQDYAKAFDFYKQAAEHEAPGAMRALGNMYRFGRGCEKNLSQAVKCYKNSIEKDKDDANAMCSLGTMYYRGEGVNKDFAEAMHWGLESAKRGYTTAMNNVGQLYEDGEGTKQDFVAAMAWYQRSADLDDADGMLYVGAMYYYGKGVSKDLCLAKKWFQKSLDAGEKEALIPLGATCYYQKDYQTAIAFFRQALTEPSMQANAEYWLGKSYHEGAGVEKDIHQAIDLFTKSAEHGRSDSLLELGDLFAKGEDVPKDQDKAREWYQKALVVGNSEAQERLNSLAAQKE